MNEYAKENGYASGCIEYEARPHLTEVVINKRNLMLMLLCIHLLIIGGLLVVTGVRRVRFAMLVNIGYFILLLLGILFYLRLNIKFG